MIKKSAVKKLKRVAKPKSIGSRDVCVDVSIITPEYTHLDNLVNYGLFEDDGDPAIVPKKGIAKVFNATAYSNVCFSGLLRQIINKKANRMYYTIETVLPSPNKKNYPPILTPEERVKWLVLAKEHKLLPEYINENSFITNKPPSEIAKATFILDLKDLTASMLYVYLSTIRNIREDPGLPKAVLYLVEEFGMNFYLAYVFASSIVLSSTGHHILNTQRAYGAFKQVYDNRTGYAYTPITSPQINKTIETSVSTAIGIQRLVNDPNKYDKSNITKKDSYFSCNSTIHGISKVGCKALLRELFDDDIISATMSKTDSEANKYINRFTNNRACLACKGAGK